jgi:hypothetical protein
LAATAATTTTTTTMAGGAEQVVAMNNNNPPPSDDCCITVLLNPTLIDTRPPGTVEMDVGAGSSRPDLITLQLRYYNDGIDVKTATPEMLALPSSTGGVLPLADYLIIG